MASDQTRSYVRSESVVFLKTKEAFGGLSNMAGGFPLQVNGLRIFTAEALYQACRFPHRPEVQRLIIGQTSPMTAKMKSKPYRHDSRPDWDQVRVKIMRWSLRVKLAQNWIKFSDLLLATGDRPIVEESHKDDFWGAKPIDECTLVGTNVLGRLLMELREAVKNDEHDSLLWVEPLAIPDFLLDGRPIQTVSVDSAERRAPIPPTTERREQAVTARTDAIQVSLFEQPAVKEAPVPYTASDDAQVAIAALDPYPAMKDSGVPWLGKVPAHWEVRRGKNLFRCIDVRSLTGDEELLTVSSDRGVVPRRSAAVTMFKAESYIGHKLCWPGDLVINSLWAWAHGLGVSQFHGIVSTAYGVYRPRPGCDIDSRFIHELVRSTPFQWELQVRSKGVWTSRLQLTDESFLGAPFPCPPPSEQAAIVRFLGHADRRIRRNIRAKQKLIKLLEEQKQAIIHRAVTRGLDRNVRLKPSGVEWLGEVPEHWEVVRLGRLIRLTTGFPFKSDGFSQSLGDVRLLRGINIAPGRIRWEAVVRWPRVVCDTFTEFEMKPGDIVLGMDRPIISGGVRVAVITEEDVPSLLLQRVARIRPVEELNAKFVLLLLSGKSFSDYLAPIFTGISVPHVSPEQIGAFRIAMPGNKEQATIVGWVTDATAAINTAIDRAQREISLLREYRTRLIADVVTGKLDVRAAAANLPDKSDEPEAFDDTDAPAEGDEPTDGDLDAALEEAEA